MENKYLRFYGYIDDPIKNATYHNGDYILQRDELKTKYSLYDEILNDLRCRELDDDVIIDYLEDKIAGDNLDYNINIKADNINYQDIGDALYIFTNYIKKELDNDIINYPDELIKSVEFDNYYDNNGFDGFDYTATLNIDLDLHLNYLLDFINKKLKDFLDMSADDLQEFSYNIEKITKYYFQEDGYDQLIKSEPTLICSKIGLNFNELKKIFKENQDKYVNNDVDSVVHTDRMYKDISYIMRVKNIITGEKTNFNLKQDLIDVKRELADMSLATEYISLSVNKVK